MSFAEGMKNEYPQRNARDTLPFLATQAPMTCVLQSAQLINSFDNVSGYLVEVE